MNEKLIQVIKDVIVLIRVNKERVDIENGKGYVAQTVWSYYNSNIPRQSDEVFINSEDEICKWCSSLNAADLLETGLTEHEVMELLT